jgi:hypothetical protein
VAVIFLLAWFIGRFFWLRRVVIGVVCMLSAPVVVLDGDSAVFGSCGRVVGFGRCISVCGRWAGASRRLCVVGAGRRVWFFLLYVASRLGSTT